MHTIAVAGHICLDLAPQLHAEARLEPGRLIEVGPLSLSLGGSVANTGRALADLGASVTPFAVVGDDELGDLLVSKLAAEGFAPPRLTVSERLGTSYSVVIEAPAIDRTFWHYTGANDEFDGSTVDITGHGLLHVGYPSLLPGLLTDRGGPLHELLARARAAGATTSLDLAVIDQQSPVAALDWNIILTTALAECDIATPSLDDLVSALGIDEPYSPQLVDRLADRMLDDGVAVVAISAGRHGLRLRTADAARLRDGGAVLASLADAWADTAMTVAPIPIEYPVTTNGAGDASTAGLLYALTRSASPDQATALAVACSAAVIAGSRPTPNVVVDLAPAVANLVGV